MHASLHISADDNRFTDLLRWTVLASQVSYVAEIDLDETVTNV